MFAYNVLAGDDSSLCVGISKLTGGTSTRAGAAGELIYPAIHTLVHALIVYVRRGAHRPARAQQVQSDRRPESSAGFPGSLSMPGWCTYVT